MPAKSLRQKSQVSIQVPDAIKSTLTQFAKKRKMTLSEVVRFFIEPSIGQRKIEKRNQKKAYMTHRFESGILYLSFDDLT